MKTGYSFASFFNSQAYYLKAESLTNKFRTRASSNKNIKNKIKAVLDVLPEVAKNMYMHKTKTKKVHAQNNA